MTAPRRTVLIADDEEMIRNLTSDLVSSLGHEVLEAANGEQAVELFEANRESIGLVILDLSMPVMDGAHAFEKLRSVDKDLKIVLSSGFTDDPSIVRLLQKGAFGVLTKPYRIDDLTKTIARAFSE